MISVMSAQSTARNIPAEIPYSSAPTKAIGRFGAPATIASPAAPTAHAAQMTGLRPTRSEIFAAGIVRKRGRKGRGPQWDRDPRRLLVAHLRTQSPAPSR